jgi:sodium-dependent dicarboxylate transporter 2/3/5
MKKEQIGLWLGILLFVLSAFVLPFDMPDTGKYTLAITCLMATWWVTEALPLPITALLPLVLFPVMGVLPLEKASAGYSSPIIYLFLGGFMLAIAIERWNLHKRIALAIITRIGNSLSLLVLGFIIATGVLSMWISNTATALMMLPIGLAVMSQLANVEDENIRAQAIPFGKALLLGIAYSSSIGGIATLVGTPTNMVFTSYAEKNYPDMPVNFADWLWFALPPVLVLLGLCWWYLVRFGYVLTAKLSDEVKSTLKEENRKLGAWTYEEKCVLIVFSIVALSWILRGFVLDYLKTNFDISIKGVSDTTIALIGAASLFLIPSRQKPEEKMLTWEAASKLPWDVILLFGGGLALADGFDSSGLAGWIAAQLNSLNGIPFLLLLFAISVLVLILTEFASNVATVSMMLPVLASLSVSLNVHPYILMISATCVASAGFMMPMGTAANALVFGTGHLKIGDMIRAGFWLDLISIVLFTLYAYWATPFFFVK